MNFTLNILPRQVVDRNPVEKQNFNPESASLERISHGNVKCSLCERKRNTLFVFDRSTATRRNCILKGKQNVLRFMKYRGTKFVDVNFSNAHHRGLVLSKQFPLHRSIVNIDAQIERVH